MSALATSLTSLRKALRQRRVAEGIGLLDREAGAFRSAKPGSSELPALTICVAQWVDLGYRDFSLLEELLQRFTPALRGDLTLRDYVCLQLADAFRAMLLEDADTAIGLIAFALQALQGLDDEHMLVTAHFWKGRSHRKKGEYEAALRHIVEARTLAQKLSDSKMAAAIQIQEAWLIFQKGNPDEALQLFHLAEKELKRTDDALSLGNIESARGRIVRRAGEYAEALEHYHRAIAIYSRCDSTHRNLARVLVNSAYVKRLVALQLRKRIDARATRAGGAKPGRGSSGGEHAKYAQLCKEALEQLRQAGEIYALHDLHSGTGSVLVNTGYLHLDGGDIEQAAMQAELAYQLAEPKHDQILMARARTLAALVENMRVEEQLGEDADVAVYANKARRFSEQAVSLAKLTQNRRLLAGAYIAQGMTCANDFFQEWEEARSFSAQAAALLQDQDRDHLWEDLMMLKSRVLRSSKINETLRAWSEGMVGKKTFQQITEEFAEIVIPKVWAREGRKISRVSESLSISPKKVRRILRNAGHLEPGSR
jgi:tetratricopeptide (TPR) repeat protein